ncbi:MAG TPA: hypothetical protein VJL28_05825 [Gemmatimonadaceae bacterium]|nr:hypothetical protein [Gemmatimonadaceae bacterium]
MSASEQHSGAARARRIGLGVLLALGAMDAWFFQRWNVDPDGVSYVDLAIGFAARGPSALVSAYWSPLFPALLGLGYKVVPPTIETMYRTAHAVSFAVWIAATFAFARLLAQLSSRVAAFREATPRAQVAAIAVAWGAYALFVLKGLGVRLVTPDAGVCLVVFWTTGELLALRDAPWRASRWIRLGAALALGYWWKAILFPAGLVAFGAAALVALRRPDARRDAWRGPLAGAMAYAALSLVLIVPVSRHAGRITFSETGRLNYLWYVTSSPYVWDRCRDPRISDEVAARFGRIHADPVLALDPLTCALPELAPEATQPMWFDTAFWFREAHAAPSVALQWRAIRNNAGYVLAYLSEYAPWAFPALVLAGLLALALGGVPRGAWPVAALVIVPCALYLAVYVELRHLSPFFAVGAAVAPLLALRAGRRARALFWALAIVVLADTAARVSTQTLIELTFVRRAVTGTLSDRTSPTQRVARALARAGLTPGTRIVGINNLWNPEWAQLAQLRIRAAVPELGISIVRVDRALRDPCTLAAWSEALRSDSIRAAVARIPMGLPVPPGFAHAAEDFYVLALDAVPPCARAARPGR